MKRNKSNQPTNENAWGEHSKHNIIQIKKGNQYNEDNDKQNKTNKPKSKTDLGFILLSRFISIHIWNH